MILFPFKRVRTSPGDLLSSALLTLAGMAPNRFDVSWLAVRHYDPLTHFPPLVRISVSVGIFSFSILASGLAVKHPPVFKPGFYNRLTDLTFLQKKGVGA